MQWINKETEYIIQYMVTNLCYYYIICLYVLSKRSFVQCNSSFQVNIQIKLSKLSFFTEESIFKLSILLKLLIIWFHKLQFQRLVSLRNSLEIKHSRFGFSLTWTWHCNYNDIFILFWYLNYIFYTKIYNKWQFIVQIKKILQYTTK